MQEFSTTHRASDSALSKERSDLLGRCLKKHKRPHGAANNHDRRLQCQSGSQSHRRPGGQSTYDRHTSHCAIGRAVCGGPRAGRAVTYSVRRALRPGGETVAPRSQGPLIAVLPRHARLWCGFRRFRAPRPAVPDARGSANGGRVSGTPRHDWLGGRTTDGWRQGRGDGGTGRYSEAG